MGGNASSNEGEEWTISELKQWNEQAKTKNVSFHHFTTDGTQFAEGTFRICYSGTEKSSGKRVVLKQFKEYHPDRVTEDVKVSAEAERVAQLFNAEVHSTKPITFVQPVVTRCNSDAKAPFRAKEYILVEPYLGSNYEKYNLNSGLDFGTGGQSMGALSHFSYHNSDRQMLLCDLQGVKRDAVYILTDPAICSLEQEFGSSDLGEAGIQSFFYYHKCTDLCKSTWKKHKKPKPYPNPASGTTFL